MPLHTTNDPALRAAHAAKRVGEDVWNKTGNGTLSSKVESDYLSEMLHEMFPQQVDFPPCPNEDCECFGLSGRVGSSSVGGDFYCYQCCQTF